MGFSSHAALPPMYQNDKDFKVISNFIQSHLKVVETLKSIDFRNKTVYFGEECEAVFARKIRIRPPGWVGPAAALEFKHSNCDIE